MFKTIEQKNQYFTLTELSEKFKLSTSVVSHALVPLRGLGVIQVGKVKSKVIDTERLLFFWATRRSVTKDIVYKTYSLLPVMEREVSLPSEVYLTAYSYCRLFLKDVAADYANIYFYSKDLEEIQKRFPPDDKNFPNLFVLKADQCLTQYKTVPLAQVFADLWNLREWYAKDFSDLVLARIKEEAGL